MAANTTNIINPTLKRKSSCPMCSLHGAWSRAHESVQRKPQAKGQSKCRVAESLLQDQSQNIRDLRADRHTNAELALSWAVRYDTTPYRPAVADSSAMAAKAPTSTELSHWPCSVRSSTTDIGRRHRAADRVRKDQQSF